MCVESHEYGMFKANVPENTMRVEYHYSPLEDHMRTTPIRLSLAIATAGMLTLAACGGGGSGSTSTSSTPTITGVAATGAAMANANVTITNSAGNSPCTESSITTSALGSYTCTLKSGETAPFFVVVTDPTGNSAPLVSVATTTPTAGTPLTVNATPLTTAIVAQLSSDGNALTLVNSHTINSADLETVKTRVVTQLAQVLTSVGAGSGYDPFTTSITAATSSSTGNTADLVLDVVKVVTDPSTGKLALSTISDPTPIVLASTSSAGSPVATPDTGLSSLSQGAQIAAKAFEACFALPSTSRVLAKDDTIVSKDGGPKVTSVATACENMAADTQNAANFAFKHNGYASGQFFYGMLTSAAMDGAKFSVPEIMAFYPRDNTASSTEPAYYDRAVVNIKFIDGSGNPGNKITVAAKIPGTSSSTRDTEWWLVGNQHAADVSIQTTVRRVEQLKSGSGPFTTGVTSTFQSGIVINVNTAGPGSVDGSGNQLNFVRVSGPGLPGNGAANTGLVYTYNTLSGASYMDLYSKTGALTGGLACGYSNGSNCPNFWLARTTGINSTLGTNPTGQLWAQGSDGVDTSQFKKGAKYKFELFYGTNTTTADVTIHKTLLVDLIQPANAINLPWNTLGAQSQAGLVDGLTEQIGITVDWIQNTAAQQIGGVQIWKQNNSYSGTTAVAKGLTSVNVPKVPVPATSTTAGRIFLFSYRMTDGSSKTMTYAFN